VQNKQRTLTYTLRIAQIAIPGISESSWPGLSSGLGGAALARRVLRLLPVVPGGMVGMGSRLAPSTGAGAYFAE
jgi:hypothetical protein